MFAYLGIIFPVLIFIDYSVFEQSVRNENVVEKYYKLRDNLNSIEYHIYTNSYHLLSDQIFFEQINKNDNIKIFRTKIFKTVTNVTIRKDFAVYKCNPTNIYNWPIFIIGLTFICSTITLFLVYFFNKKRDAVKNDTIINFGIFNAIICLITIFSALFQIFD